MAIAVACSRCLRRIPDDAPYRLCPVCSFAVALHETPGFGRDDQTPKEVTPETLSVVSPPATEPTLTFGDKDKTRPKLDLPGFETLGILGEGGSGIVYKVRQTLTKRIWALKVLQKQTTPILLERFKREIEVIAALKHPHVVPIHDVGEHAGMLYFTMPYITGGTLAEYIKKQRLTFEQSVRVVERLACTMVDVHAKGFLHRDLKPGNVLLDPPADGSPLTPDNLPDALRIADFGLAKVIASQEEDQDTASLLTMTGAIVGTPAYMPPELAFGLARSADETADVYSLGATLYHLLTRTLPFTGSSSAEVIEKVRTEEPSPLRRLDATIPEGLELLTLRCMEKRPQDRYPSAAELVAELERWLNGQALVVRPPTLWKRGVRWSRRHQNRLAQGTLLLLTLVSLAFGAAAYWSSSPKDDGQGQAPEDPMKVALARMKQDLLAGKKVVLIGSQGEPKWWNTAEGTMSFSKLKSDENACSIESVGETRIELVPEELVPKAYRIRAEMRHNMGDHPSSRAGLALFYREVPTISPARITVGFDMVYNDFPAARGQELTDLKAVWLIARVTMVSPNIVTRNSENTVGRWPITPPPHLTPRVWRTLEVEVQPNAVACSYTDEAGKKNVINPKMTRTNELNDVYQNLVSKYRKLEIVEDRPVNPWSSQGSIGLKVQQGSVSFRNVTIEPLDLAN